ncbi:MAG: hypothetical protein Q9172_006906 [Xanthocarpia lactea]
MFFLTSILLGNGNSSYPDALREAQTQVYVETIHQVIQQLKAGEIDGIRWRRVALVGFSIGGIVANSITDQYPLDLDTVLLHGISWDVTWLYPAFIYGVHAPAAQIDPERWGHLPLQYLTHPTPEARETACFYGSFDRNILAADFYYRDFDSLGAAITLTYHLVDAPEYRGPVFLGIGESKLYASIFSQPLELPANFHPYPDDNTFCGGPRCLGQAYEVYNRYPAASNHTVKVYANTGHLILYHHTGTQLMEDSLQFLRAHGF